MGLLIWFELLESSLQDELHESQAETATAWQKLGSLSERAAATEKELKDAQAAASEAEAASSKQIQQLKVGNVQRCSQGCLTRHTALGELGLGIWGRETAEDAHGAASEAEPACAAKFACTLNELHPGCLLVAATKDVNCARLKPVFQQLAAWWSVPSAEALLGT